MSETNTTNPTTAAGFKPKKSVALSGTAAGNTALCTVGRSGNDRPAGVTSTLYCTFPQSHLESEAGFDPAALPPGMPRP